MGGLFTRLWVRLFGKVEVRMMMIGLDAAGKTTILYKLKLGEVVTTVPTIGFNVETVEYRNVNFTVWDVGGQSLLRPLWRHYYEGSNGMIFVVDSCDEKRFDEARETLLATLVDETLTRVPVLVFANKQDRPGARPVKEVAAALQLDQLKDREWYIQGTSALHGDGLYEGFDWLSGVMAKRS